MDPRGCSAIRTTQPSPHVDSPASRTLTPMIYHFAQDKYDNFKCKREIASIWTPSHDYNGVVFTLYALNG